MSESASAFPKNKLFIAGVLLLLIAVAVLGYLNYKAISGVSAGLPEGEISVTAMGTGAVGASGPGSTPASGYQAGAPGTVTLKVLTIDDLRKLPAVEKRMTIPSSRGTTKHDFTGTSLLGVLDSIDPGLTRKYTRIVTRGADGYTSVIGMSELLLPDNVYLVYEDFGKPLPTRTGKDGAVQVIICSDQFGRRFTNWLVNLELQ
jgi:hypothetical protein